MLFLLSGYRGMNFQEKQRLFFHFPWEMKHEVTTTKERQHPWNSLCHQKKVTKKKDHQITSTYVVQYIKDHKSILHFLHTRNSQEGSSTKMKPFPRKNCSWYHILDFGHPELVTLTNDPEWLIWANYTKIPKPELFGSFLMGIHLHNQPISVTSATLATIYPDVFSVFTISWMDMIGDLLFLQEVFLMVSPILYYRMDRHYFSWTFPKKLT